MNNDDVVVPESHSYYEPVVEPVAVESIVVEPTPEPEVFTTPEVIEELPAVEPEVKPAKSKKLPEAAPDSFADDEVILLSSLKFEAISRNSRSVYLVQERLYQLGFDGGYEDQPGWLSHGTRRALAEFASSDETSVRVDDAELIARLFAGTSVKIS